MPSLALLRYVPMSRGTSTRSHSGHVRMFPCAYQKRGSVFIPPRRSVLGTQERAKRALGHGTVRILVGGKRGGVRASSSSAEASLVSRRF